MRTSSIALHHVAGGLFGPGNLVRRCREDMYHICPELAEKWFANSDFTQWTFQIRKGVTWHDGTPFTADDAKFWLDLSVSGAQTNDRTRAPAYYAGEIAPITAVEVMPGEQLRVSLAGPSYFFIEPFTNPRLKTGHPKHLMAQRIDKGEMSVSPLDIGLVGTGPFRFRGYEKGTVVRLARYDGYWERDARPSQLPFLDAMDFVIIPEPASMDAAFRTGRIDGGARGEGHYLTTERRAGYDRDMAGRVFYGEMQGGLFRLAFNVLNEGPWQDVRVRQAMALWVDKQAAIPAALGGKGYFSPVLSPNNPLTSREFGTWPGFNPATREADRAEAGRLLAEAGYGKGFAMSHLCRALHSIRCEFLQGQLAGLGITLRLSVVDEAAWGEGRLTLAYDSQQGAFFTSPIPEATEGAFGRYSTHPDAYAKHEDPMLDQLYHRIGTSRQPAQRMAAWRDLERYIVRDQVYVIPIAGSYQTVPYRTYVRGLAIPAEDGHGNTDFATVWLDRR
jgi:peptide/nickel transport system substrate-binding protein